MAVKYVTTAANTPAITNVLLNDIVISFTISSMIFRN